ncbi:FUSC family protein [Nitrospirillum sp. BR 11828]|uniref:FUSC family protein n=1 Tax=Nitrospirillum sp. BR 11828 TaxID=3104325 RepID=UPI002ACAC2BB|nr:FUSC family protein [Nitrospirillum sp. BR 11828]MDZ5648693.1 FUSC family protein [Nitrospirillum sp. BR 11828]
MATLRAPELRLAFRVTVAGVAALAMARLVNLPQSYWAVITAIMVMQTSIGGSLKAALDRFAGTLAGAAWGALVASVGLRDSPLHLCLTLAVALAPLAWLAARHPVFKLAPVTATIVLLTSASSTESSLALAMDRVFEIVIGNIVGLAVALFVLPSRAYGTVLTTAARVADLCADMLDALLDPALPDEVRQGLSKRHAQLWAALRPLDTAVEEAQRERRTWLGDQRDPAPLVRTLTRVRHDLVMVGRATADRAASDGAAARRLEGPQGDLRRQGVLFLRHAATALRAQGQASPTQAPDIEPVQAAARAYLDTVQTLRAEGVLRELPRGVTGQIYTLSFALEQLTQDLTDLHARTAEMIPPPRHGQGIATDRKADAAAVQPTAVPPTAEPPSA